MKKHHVLALCLVTLLCAEVAMADGTSYVGTLADPNATFEVTLTLASTSDVTLQTYGFGGGTNQAGKIGRAHV